MNFSPKVRAPHGRGKQNGLSCASFRSARSSADQSIGLRSQGSWVRIPPGAPRIKRAPRGALSLQSAVLRNPMLLEPGEHALPAVLRGFLAVARAVVGVEGMRHAFVDMDLRLLVVAEGLEAGAHALHEIQRDSLV